MSSKSQNPAYEQIIRDRMAQLETALTLTQALDDRKRALALSANDAARGWAGFASRPGYDEALSVRDTALRRVIADMQSPAMAEAATAMRQATSPLPDDTCRIFGVVSGNLPDGVTVQAVKEGGAVLTKTALIAGGQYTLDTRCTDTSITLEIRDGQDRLLLQDGTPVALRTGMLIERNYTINRCGDLVPEPAPDDNPRPVMPDLIGKTAQDAEQMIAKAGRFPVSFSQKHDPEEKGIVIDQDPAAGNYLTQGASISLTLSRGPEPETKMPDLIGKTAEAARKLLTGLPFAALGLDYVDAPDNVGKVVKQDPAAGAPLGADMQILLCIGQAQKKMPDVIGKTEERARTMLIPSFAGTIAVSYTDDGEKPGIVIDQDPPAGQSFAEGTPIKLLVTSPKDEVLRMPDLRGQTRKAAETLLARLGDMKVTIQTGPSDMDKGLVYAQDPAPGALLTVGAAPRIDISTGPQDDLLLPNLVGLTEAQARETLIPRYADDISVSFVPSDNPAGTVIAQSPKAGTSIARGQKISLDIAEPDKDSVEITMPDLHGLTAAQAKKSLKEFGMANITYDEAEARRRNYVVIKQQPAAGRKVATTIVVRLQFGPRS